MNNAITHTIGIDIAKDTFSVRLLSVGNDAAPLGDIQKFPNSTEGYAQMKRWVVEQGAEPASESGHHGSHRGLLGSVCLVLP